MNEKPKTVWIHYRPADGTRAGLMLCSPTYDASTGLELEALERLAAELRYVSENPDAVEQPAPDPDYVAKLEQLVELKLSYARAPRTPEPWPPYFVRESPTGLWHHARNQYASGLVDTACGVEHYEPGQRLVFGPDPTPLLRSVEGALVTLGGDLCDTCFHHLKPSR